MFTCYRTKCRQLRTLMNDAKTACAKITVIIQYRPIVLNIAYASVMMHIKLRECDNVVIIIVNFIVSTCTVVHCESKTTPPSFCHKLSKY